MISLESELLFFFSALGVFNTGVLGAYLLFVKNIKIQNAKALGALLLLVTVRVGVSCFYFHSQSFPLAWIQVGLTSNVMAGSVLLALLRGFDREVNLLKERQFVFLSGTLLLFGILYPFGEHRYVWDFSIRYVFHALLSGYLVIGFFILLKAYRQSLQALNGRFGMLSLVYTTFTLYCLGFAISLWVKQYVLGPIIYSLLFYGAFGWYFIVTRKRGQQKYSQKRIDPGRANELVASLQQHMEDSKDYKNPNLKVDDLAKNLKIPAHQLSQLLNDNLGIGFSNFINDYRVEEAKQLLRSIDHLTIEAIGFEAGFNSKSSFYTIFKEKTQLTPAAYKKQQKVQN